MLLLPMFGLALAVWHRSTLKSLRRRGVEDESGVRRYALSALALVTFAIGIRQIAVLGLELWIRLGNRGGDLELEHRILGLASSVIVIVIGNALPKILTPFALLPPGRAALVTVARRFIGNCWVVLGLVMALAFVLAPIGFARTLQAWGMIAGFAVMLGAIVWMNLAPDRPSHDQ
jgi:hypothetical protein